MTPILVGGNAGFAHLCQCNSQREFVMLPGREIVGFGPLDPPSPAAGELLLFKDMYLLKIMLICML